MMSVSVAGIQKNRCRTTIAERMVETLSGTALYRGSGRLLKPRPGRALIADAYTDSETHQKRKACRGRQNHGMWCAFDRANGFGRLQRTTTPASSSRSRRNEPT